MMNAGWTLIEKDRHALDTGERVVINIMLGKLKRWCIIVPKWGPSQSYRKVGCETSFRLSWNISQKAVWDLFKHHWDFRGLNLRMMVLYHPNMCIMSWIFCYLHLKHRSLQAVSSCINENRFKQIRSVSFVLCFYESEQCAGNHPWLVQFHVSYSPWCTGILREVYLAC